MWLSIDVPLVMVRGSRTLHPQKLQPSNFDDTRAFLPFFAVACIRLLPQSKLLPFFPKKQSKIPLLANFSPLTEE
jgi:hypothetical protein